MPENSEFKYVWHIKLSKYNTLRFEDRNREAWQNLEFGRFIRNDRFYCENIPDEVEITIRKTYRIPLPK